MHYIEQCWIVVQGQHKQSWLQISTLSFHRQNAHYVPEEQYISALRSKIQNTGSNT